MKKNKNLFTLLTLFIILWILFPNNYLPINASLEKNIISMGNGAWMHVDTFFGKTNLQIDEFAKMLKISNITNIFILAKNIDGSLTYPSKIGIKCYKNDTMRSLVSILNVYKIKIYFYYPINTDPEWLIKNPESIAYQCGTIKSKIPIPESSHKLVNLLNKDYQSYIKKIVEEALNLYPINGIQLDYIRYINGFYGFSPEEMNEAAQRKIPVQKIIDKTYQTFVSPGDWKTILNCYENGDKDILAWAKLREDIVFRFLETVSIVVKKKGKEIGVTLVSSGATSKAYSAIHFGQSWEKMSSILNFAIPMAYHGERSNVTQFVSAVCMGALNKINSTCKIAIGIQANLTSTIKMMDAIQAVKGNHLGFVLFRIGTFTFNGFDFSPLDKNHFLLKLLINNCLEEAQIKGLTLIQTGGCLRIIDLQKNWTILKSDNNSIKLLTSRPMLFGSNEALNIKIEFNGDQIKSNFSPFITLSSNSNDFPAFNFCFFSIHQLTFDLKKKNSFYDQVELKQNFILYEKNKCWINCHNIYLIFSFNVKIEKDSISIDNGKIQLVIYQQEKRSYLILGNKKYLLLNDLFFEKNNFLPLKEILEIFKILVQYNPVENLINCLSLHRDLPTSLFGNIDIISPLDLWITDADEIIIDINNYLSSSFYLQNNKFHFLGRRIKILNKSDKISPIESEAIIMLIEESKDSLLLPDQLSYLYSNKNKNIKIPVDRELIIDESDLYCIKKNEYKNLCVITSIENIKKILTFSHCFINLSEIQISDWSNFNQINTYGVIGLYFLQSYQF